MKLQVKMKKHQHLQMSKVQIKILKKFASSLEEENVNMEDLEKFLTKMARPVNSITLRFVKNLNYMDTKKMAVN